MKNEDQLTLGSGVDSIKGVGKKYTEILEKKNIRIISDLLEVFPVYYIDFSKPEENINDNKSVYKAKVLTVNSGRNFRKRISIIRVNVLILEQKVEIVFFNQPYMKNNLMKDKVIHVFGSIENLNSKFSMTNPIVSFNYKSILPVYKNISTIKQGIIKKIILSALDNLSCISEILPEFIIEDHLFFGLNESFENIHKPSELNINTIKKSKERFIYCEFLLFQLELQFMRKLLLKKKRAFNYIYSDKIDIETKKRLEFTLTNDQKKAINNIKKMLIEPYSMACLLQGDVGSGKTIIAFLSILIAAINGYQSAILVPTEVLALQHLKEGKRFFSGFNIKVLTGSNSNMERKKTKVELLSGKIDIIIGTHSLLNEEIQFKNLAMIVIDEQHKFGVTQRASLFYKNKGVDLIVMTATPIPRTMLLSIYNDLKVFSIKDKPADRKPIKTRIIPSSDRDKFYKWLSLRVKKGEKAYIILPLIENSEFFSGIHSIEGEKAYIKECFKPDRVGIISGKTDREKRDEILNNFKEGSIRVILSTTVIEVGIDVKDASIIIIEDADRYGLAGIHQLRGRVGRGKIQSYCYLIPSKTITEAGKERLRTIENEDNGFKIAEIDLKNRGGGIIAGLSQSGDISFRNGNIKDDLELYNKSKNDASTLLKNKSLLTGHYKQYIEQMKKKRNLINFS